MSRRVPRRCVHCGDRIGPEGRMVVIQVRQRSVPTGLSPEKKKNGQKRGPMAFTEIAKEEPHCATHAAQHEGHEPQVVPFGDWYPPSA